MPPLDNPKHERFAQAVAAGKSAVDAYESAGYRRNRGHASTLRKNPKLLKRVDEILETRGQIQQRGTLAAIERTRLTKTTIIEMLLADRELARKNGQSSAAIRATELLGIELGMFIRKTHNRHSHERKLSEMSPEERAQEIQRLTGLARQVIARARTIEGEASVVDEEAG